MWTGVLCTFLALFADIQLIVVGTLPLMMPNVLWLTGTYISTIAGIVAAVTAAIIAQLLKTANESSNKDVVYTYSLFCRRIVLCISGFLYVLAIILSIVGLTVASSCSGNFRTLMINYHVEYDAKALVDNIQFALQCCGGQNYQDWFETDWGGYQNNVGKKKHGIQQLQKPHIGTTTDSTACRNDAVPFSCCARSAPSACVHQDLFQLGTSTINHCGCVKKIYSVTQAYLWFEIIMYCMALGLEIALLVLLRTHEDSREYKTSSRVDRKFGEFSNNKSKSSKSSLKPTTPSKSTPSSRTRYNTSSK